MSPHEISTPHNILKARFVAHASAVAFGGQIVDVARDLGNWHKGMAREPLSSPLFLEGVSCALPVNGGHTRTHRQNVASIDERGNRFASFTDALAETWLSEIDGNYETVSTCRVQDLQIGLVKPVRFPATEVKSTGSYAFDTKKASFVLTVPPTLTFIFDGSSCEIGIQQEVPGTYESLATAVDRGTFNVLPESPYQIGTDHKAMLTIIVSLARPTFRQVDEIGKMYFAELVAKPDERNFTLVRFELGSAAGGTASANFVSSNGGKHP
jgi:hypothetical protein